MLWTKLLLSPMPHARVTSIDASAALAMPGVKAILTADDLPGAQGGGLLGENVQASTQGERILTMEPVYEGEPILAVAAIDELTAAEAIEKIVIDYEPLPFSVDPIASLRPGGANARTQGNVWMRPPAGATPVAAAAPRAAARAAPRRRGPAPAAGPANAVAPAAPGPSPSAPPPAAAVGAAPSGAAAGSAPAAGAAAAAAARSQGAEPAR